VTTNKRGPASSLVIGLIILLLTIAIVAEHWKVISLAFCNP